MLGIDPVDPTQNGGDRQLSLRESEQKFDAHADAPLEGEIGVTDHTFETNVDRVADRRHVDEDLPMDQFPGLGVVERDAEAVPGHVDDLAVPPSARWVALDVTKAGPCRGLTGSLLRYSMVAPPSPLSASADVLDGAQ